MTDLSDELDANAEAFRLKWNADIANNLGQLGTNQKFVLSYRRLSALQALRSTLISPLYGAGISSFFVEAQNDALTSHVFASFGAWRSSLNALRSCIEDAFGALYFKDHPVEARLWESGNYRLGFSSTHKYFCDHPDLKSLGGIITGLEAIKEEYAVLSKAVHGSAKNFRMTDSTGLLLWSTQAAKLGAWETRHKKVVEAICLLTVVLHTERLQGAAHPNLRAVLGHAISASRRTQLREKLHIHIDNP